MCTGPELFRYGERVPEPNMAPVKNRDIKKFGEDKIQRQQQRAVGIESGEKKSVENGRCYQAKIKQNSINIHTNTTKHVRRTSIKVEGCKEIAKCAPFGK